MGRNEEKKNQDAATLRELLDRDSIKGLKNMSIKDKIAYGTTLGSTMRLGDFKFHIKVAKWYIKRKLWVKRMKARLFGSSKIE